MRIQTIIKIAFHTRRNVNNNVGTILFKGKTKLDQNNYQYVIYMYQQANMKNETETTRRKHVKLTL